MKLQLKKLRNQVIVLTGASSGIGLATARMAAKRGAKVVMAARNEEALREIRQELMGAGAECEYVVADVSREADVRRLAQLTLDRFGRFDTWINNAGVSIYGRLLEIPIDDLRRLFETNFWGVVYGSRTACEHLRHKGGALINLGSTVSDRAIPLQGIYSASKHAIKGFTDALRMEVEEQQAPISVTLIKPGSIDTPFPQHARNYMAVEPVLTPPVYAPEAVAEAILHAAEHPQRDVFVGSGGKAMSASGQYAPRVTDKYMERVMFSQQRTDEPAKANRSDALTSEGENIGERGNYPGYVSRTSIYTSASLHPLLTGAMLLGAGVLATSLLRSKREVPQYSEPG